MAFPEDKSAQAEMSPDTMRLTMTEIKNAEMAALWQRYQAAATEGDFDEPDFLALAEFADGKMSETDSEPVETWLAARPDFIEDLMAARHAALPEASAETPVDEKLMARAMALVATPTDSVVPLRRPAARAVTGWRGVIAWGSIAASLAATSLVGFALGNNVWSNLQGDVQISADQDLLDPPSGIFSGLAEDEGT